MTPRLVFDINEKLYLSRFSMYNQNFIGVFDQYRNCLTQFIKTFLRPYFGQFLFSEFIRCKSWIRTNRSSIETFCSSSGCPKTNTSTVKTQNQCYWDKYRLLSLYYILCGKPYSSRDNINNRIKRSRHLRKIAAQLYNLQYVCLRFKSRYTPELYRHHLPCTVPVQFPIQAISPPHRPSVPRDGQTKEKWAGHFKKADFQSLF